MNKTVTAEEANRDFSKLLASVGEGETVLITSEGKPVATLAPAREADIADKPDLAERQKAFAALMARLRSMPIVDVGKWTRDEANER